MADPVPGTALSHLPSLRLRRAMAVLSLLVGAVGVVVAVVGAGVRFPRLVVPSLVLAAAMGLGLRALGGYGLRRTRAVVGAVALAVVAVGVGLARHDEGWLLLGGCAMFLLGAVGLFQALRGTEDPGLLVDGWRAVPPARRPVLFMNPRSGGGTAVRKHLAEHATDLGVRVVELDGSRDLVELAQEAVDAGADCLGAAGGDGTLAAVATVAARAGVPFVCVPAGTRNHFALDLGLDREDPVAALAAFRDGLQRHIDLGEVSGRTFLNNVSLGAYGEVVAQEQYREHKVGTALGSLGELVGPNADPLPFRFVDGSGTQWESAVVVLVSNNVYDLSPRPGFGTRATLTDGLLGVVAVAGERVGRLLAPVQWSTEKFVVESDGPVRVGIDGEAVEVPSPVVFRVRPGALRVRIPRTASGQSPAAARFGVVRRTAGRVRALYSAHPD